jgi:hypothetical protein
MTLSRLIEPADKLLLMSIAIGIGWSLALVLFAASLWIRRQRRKGSAFSTRSGSIVDPPKRAAASEALVYVNSDGSVRELTEADKKYVETEYSPLDGARPYIKSHYSQRTALGEMRGYLSRTEVPEGMPVKPAPPETALRQQLPVEVASSIARLIRGRTAN